jgi:Domain of unknown function (DUF6458)
MGIAISLFVFAVGAILTFATNVSVSGLDLDVVGWILMLVGVVGFALNLMVWGPRRRRRAIGTAPIEVVEERRPAAPPVVERRRFEPRPEVVEERRIYDDPR